MSVAVVGLMQARACPAGRALAIIAVLLLAAGGAQAADSPDALVAQRGAVTMTAKDVQQMLTAAGPAARAQMKRDPRLLLQRVRDRMLQMVLLDQARAAKWDQRPDVAYRAEIAKEAAIAESYVASKVTLPPDYPSEKEIEAAYAANKSKLILPRQYHLAQIVVAVPPNSPESAVADAHNRAAMLRREAASGHKDFAELARRSSDDKGSAEKGGDLGWVREDILLPDLRSALAGLGINAVTEPVRTPDGWHVLKVLGVRAPAVATLAEAHDTLVRAMRQERTLQLQRQFVLNMMKTEPIRIDQVELWKQTAQ